VPVDSHLTWQEIRDFTGGLWNIDTQNIPANAAQQMQDCYPVPSGGLRAWYKPSSFPTSGIGSTANEHGAAIFVHEQLINRSGSGVGNDYYLVTYNTSDTKTRFYRMDQTAAGPPVVWTLIKTTVAGLQPNFAPSANYVLSNGDRLAVFGLGAAAGTDNGIWSVRYSDGAQTHLLSGQQAIVANYQSRLIVAGSVSNGNPAVIQFTDPGLSTGLGTNTAPVDISEGQEQIGGFATFSPGDLMVFKVGAPIYLVEGDLTNYTVRQMNGSKLGGQLPVRGPQGAIFLISNDGFYETPDGSIINPLSPQIKGSSTVGPLAFKDHWMMTGSNLVFDYETKAWFTTSFIATSSSIAIPLHKLPGFLVVDDSPLNPMTFTCVDGSTTNRAESWTWKSAPLRDPNGRQIEIRAIEVVHRAPNGATASLTVTVDGQARTVACDSSGRGSVTVYFVKRRETLDITITAASNAAGVEAPQVEAVRVGTQSGHFLTTGSDVG
jgi:hypothetical protein